METTVKSGDSFWGELFGSEKFCHEHPGAKPFPLGLHRLRLPRKGFRRDFPVSLLLKACTQLLPLVLGPSWRDRCLRPRPFKAESDGGSVQDPFLCLGSPGGWGPVPVSPRYLSWLTSQNKGLPLLFHSVISMGWQLSSLVSQLFALLENGKRPRGMRHTWLTAYADPSKEAGTLGGKALCGQVGADKTVERTGWGQIA